MTLSLFLACSWVIASTILALFPMRYQFIPGVCLLLAAPILIVLLAQDYGAWQVGLFVFALVSLYRRPLLFYGHRMVERNRG